MAYSIFLDRVLCAHRLSRVAAMIALLRRLFAPKPERHYRDHRENNASSDLCVCGYHSPWDYDLRTHFQETGRIGK